MKEIRDDIGGADALVTYQELGKYVKSALTRYKQRISNDMTSFDCLLF